MSVESVRLEWRGQIDDVEIVELTQAHGGRAEPGWWDVLAEALGILRR